MDPSRQSVQPQACPTTSATTDYSSQYQNYQQAYSYGQVQSQYMGSFGGAYSTNQFNPYERYENIKDLAFIELSYFFVDSSKCPLISYQLLQNNVQRIHWPKSLFTTFCN